MISEDIISTENKTCIVKNEAKEITSRKSNLPNEGSENYELSSFKHPKSWKKSLSGFFRNQLRSSKSINGDHTDRSKNDYDSKEVTTEQKWQSLGKIFRRQSFIDQHPHTERESNSQKRLAVRSVLSSYFGKYKVRENANEKS